MKIKKLSEDIIFRKTTTEFKFDVNGKEVSVYLYEDSEGIDNDYNIEGDLTEEEMELFSDYMIDLYELKVGKIKEIEG